MALTMSDNVGTMLFHLRNLNNSFYKPFVLSQSFELRIGTFSATSKMCCHHPADSQKGKEGQKNTDVPSTEHRRSQIF